MPVTQTVGMVSTPGDSRRVQRAHQIGRYGVRFPREALAKTVRSCFSIQVSKGEETRAAVLDHAVEVARRQGLGGLTIGTLACIALAAFVIPRLGIAAAWRAPMFFAAVMVMLLENVYRGARRL